MTREVATANVSSVADASIMNKSLFMAPYIRKARQLMALNTQTARLTSSLFLVLIVFIN